MSVKYFNTKLAESWFLLFPFPITKHRLTTHVGLIDLRPGVKYFDTLEEVVPEREANSDAVKFSSGGPRWFCCSTTETHYLSMAPSTNSTKAKEFKVKSGKRYVNFSFCVNWTLYLQRIKITYKKRKNITVDWNK